MGRDDLTDGMGHGDPGKDRHVWIHEITCDLRIQDMTADVGS